MQIDYLNFGFYTIDVDYVRYLHSVDSEVFYNSQNYEHKPYIGIIVGIDDYKYFVPLTSAKKKHSKWRNESNSHILIYENVPVTQLKPKYIWKRIPRNNLYVEHILGAIIVNKMIPVLDNLYTRIDINNIQDLNYRNLLWKEIVFCASISDKLLTKIENVYSKQKKTNNIHYQYVNFSLLENASKKYISK